MYVKQSIDIFDANLLKNNKELSKYIRFSNIILHKKWNMSEKRSLVFLALFILLIKCLQKLFKVLKKVTKSNWILKYTNLFRFLRIKNHSG